MVDGMEAVNSAARRPESTNDVLNRTDALAHRVSHTNVLMGDCWCQKIATHIGYISPNILVYENKDYDI